MRKYPCENPSALCKKTSVEQCKNCYKISKSCSYVRAGCEQLAKKASKILKGEIDKAVKEKKDA